jgi:hypothetical protein
MMETFGSYQLVSFHQYFLATLVVGLDQTVRFGQRHQVNKLPTRAPVARPLPECCNALFLFYFFSNSF